MCVYILKSKTTGLRPQDLYPNSWGLKKYSPIVGMATTEVEKLKKCSNCTRAPQPFSQFVNGKGKECSTCLKCREKGKKGDNRPERRDAHNELQRDRRYDVKWRAKQLEERPDEFREHNNKRNKQWRAENSEHSSKWYKTSVNSRLDALKRAAEVRSIEWQLTDEEAKTMMTSPCIYCKHIDLEVRVNGIDRLDSGKSYTAENCRACCKNCNYMKGTLDPRTFIQLAKRIAECDANFPDIPACDDHKRRKKQNTVET
jgi:hypothetical protein